jgi:DNA-binding ferritin-like protein
VDLPTEGTSTELLELVDEDIEAMIEQYHELYEAAEDARMIDISNFAQDQVGQLAKFRWMIESTLDEREEE